MMFSLAGLASKMKAVQPSNQKWTIPLPILGHIQLNQAIVYGCFQK